LTVRRLLAAGVLVVLALSACSKVGDTGSTGANRAHADRPRAVDDLRSEGAHPAFASATPTLELSALAVLVRGALRRPRHAVPDAVSEIPSIANGDVAKDGLTIKYKLRTASSGTTAKAS